MNKIVRVIRTTAVAVLCNAASRGTVHAGAPSADALTPTSQLLSSSMVEKQVEFFPRPLQLYSAAGVIDKVVVDDTSTTRKAKTSGNRRETKLITRKNLQRTREVLTATTNQLMEQAHLLGLGLANRSKTLGTRVQTVNQQQFQPFMTSVATGSKHALQRSMGVAGAVSHNLMDNTKHFTSNVMEHTKVASSKLTQASGSTLKQCIKATSATCQTTNAKCKTIGGSMARGSKSAASTFAAQSKLAVDRSVQLTGNVCQATATTSKVVGSQTKDLAIIVSKNVSRGSKAAGDNVANISSKAYRMTATQTRIAGANAKMLASHAAQHSKTTACKVATASSAALDRSIVVTGNVLKTTGAKSKVVGSQMKHAAGAISKDVKDISQTVGSTVAHHSKSAASSVAKQSRSVLNQSVAVASTACKATTTQSKVVGSQVKHMACTVGDTSQVMGATVARLSKSVAGTLASQSKIFMNRYISFTSAAYQNTATKSKILTSQARTFAVAVSQTAGDKTKHFLNSFVGGNASVKTVSALDRSKNLLRAGGTETIHQARRTSERITREQASSTTPFRPTVISK